MKKQVVIIIFMLLMASVTHVALANNYRNQNDFNVIKTAFVHLKEGIRSSVFERDYGLIWSSVEFIDQLYRDGIQKEGGSSFSDRFCALAFLYFQIDKTMEEDRQLSHLKAPIAESERAILNIVKRYGWGVKIRSGDTYTQYTSLELQKVYGQFYGQRYLVYQGVSLSKIFATAIPELVTSLENDMGLHKNEHKVIFDIQTAAIAIMNGRGSDSSRSIDRAGRRIINLYDNNLKTFQSIRRDLRRSGNVAAISHLNVLRTLVIAFKEFKNFGAGYTY